MAAHTECQHAATPPARRACRILRQFIAQAERHGLVAVPCDLGEGPRYVVWAQYRIKNPERRFGSEILVTVASNTPSFVLCYPGQETIKLSLHRARLYLGIINI